jgi:hypothetical protein
LLVRPEVQVLGELAGEVRHLTKSFQCGIINDRVLNPKGS